MRRLPGSLLLSVLLLAAAATSARAAEDADAYARGRDAIFEERWEDARRHFEEFARKYPSSALADDAHYWLGMALYEVGESERAYAILKSMEERYPSSPWADDARVLMVRCAEAVLTSLGPAPRATGALPPASPRAAEYEAFIEKSTRDRSAKVQLLAIDTLLVSRPARASELLPRLSGSAAPREAAGLVLDRFFGDSRVKVTIEEPERGFTEGNVAVIVRDGGEVNLLGLAEALDLTGGRAPGSRFNPAVHAEIRDKLLKAERSLVQDGGPGSVEVGPVPESRTHSAIVKVVDGEVHYYRNGAETLRVVVLNRNSGFRQDNVRIFMESPSGVREFTLQEARSLPGSGSGLGLAEPTVRFLKATLAIIEIDLTKPAGTSPR